MIPLNELFAVQYGHSLELNRLDRTTPDRGIPFVSRSERNNGIVAYVEKIWDHVPYDAGDITCALSGSVMAAFVQTRPYYTAFHVACLRPRQEMSFAQKLFYCSCLRANRFRYGYGRQANRTLKDLLIPSLAGLPEWLDQGEMKPTRIANSVAKEIKKLELTEPIEESNREYDTVNDLFDIQYGNSYELCYLKRDPNGINFVSRRTGNNGVCARVEHTDIPPFAAGCLTVALSGQGGTMETCLQPAPFYTAYHVAVLYPRQPMSVERKLFYCVALKMNRFRYGFGRQANRTLSSLRLPPVPAWLDESIVTSVKARLVGKVAGAFS